VAEIKDKELNPDSESDYENNGKGQIIDADPTAIVATATIQPKEPTDPEEGEHLFHSQMWVLTGETVHPSTGRVEPVRGCLNNPSRLVWTTLTSLTAPLAALRSRKETKEKVDLS
jgi:hypothetical protein